MKSWPDNKPTRVNARGQRQRPLRTRSAARIAQFACQRIQGPLLMLLLIVASGASGCVTQPWMMRPEGTRLSKQQAIRIARQEARRDGYHLIFFLRSPPHYVVWRGKISWQFDFERIIPKPGAFAGENSFSVCINDTTGKPTLTIPK
jgi:hypothetical protein